MDNPWPTEPVRFTGVTDVVIPAMRSWPDHDAAKVATRPIVRHGVTMRPGEPGFGLLLAGKTVADVPRLVSVTGFAAVVVQNLDGTILVDDA